MMMTGFLRSGYDRSCSNASGEANTGPSGPTQRANHPLKLLFVCRRNKIRSLTAEKIFAGVPGIAVRSAGTEASARIKVTPGHIGWADIVLALEKSHADKLRHKFGDALRGKKLVTLNIRDRYGLMDPKLIQLLRRKVAACLGGNPSAETIPPAC